MCDSVVLAKDALTQNSVIKIIYLLFIVIICLISKQWGFVGISLAINFAGFIDYGMMASLALSLVGGKFSDSVKTQLRGLIIALIAIGWYTNRILFKVCFEIKDYIFDGSILLCLISVLIVIMLFPGLVDGKTRYLIKQMTQVIKKLIPTFSKTAIKNDYIKGK